MKNIKILIIIVLLFSAAACKSRQDKANSVESKVSQNETIAKRGTDLNTDTTTALPPTQDAFADIEIIREIPHATDAYTQGLIYYNGLLYESTGEYGESSLRKIDPETGEVIYRVNIDKKYFAEGITILNNKIYQLTWRSNTGFIYNLADMSQTGVFSYYGEGWGITDDGKNLIMSDGTNAIRFLDPKTFEIVRTIFVVDENSFPLRYLNELEYINGEIWANVYTKNIVVRINPADGRVVSTIDLSFLRDKIDITPTTDVLNGIAYDKKHDNYYFTGKNWNKIFVVKMK